MFPTFPDHDHARSAIPCVRRRRAAAGFAIPGALFLLVILALLGAFALTVSGLQSSAQALDVSGVRAYQAARAGVEWGLAQVLDPTNADAGLSAVPPRPPACFTSPASLTLGSEFDGTQVSVTCSRTTTTESDRQIAVYSLVSTVSGGGGALPVSREIRVTASRCTDPSGIAPRFPCP